MGFYERKKEMVVIANNDNAHFSWYFNSNRSKLFIVAFYICFILNILAYNVALFDETYLGILWQEDTEIILNTVIK